MKHLLALVAVGCLVGTAYGDNVLYDSQGFEPALYTLGNLPGQDGWVDDTTDAGYGQVQVVNDPTASGRGQVICLDAPGTAGGWLGAARSYGPSTLATVTIEWDQWRADTNDNLWIADTTAFDGWWAMQWDQNGQASSYYFDFGVAVTPGVWQHVKYTLNMPAGSATVDIDGTSFSSSHPDLTIDGIVFENEPTDAGGAGGPIYIDNLRVVETPEPASLALLALGGLALARRRVRG